MSAIRLAVLDDFRRCHARYRMIHREGYRPDPDVLDLFEEVVRDGLRAFWSARVVGKSPKAALAAASAAVRARKDAEAVGAVARVAVEHYAARWRIDGLHPVGVGSEFVAPLVYPATGQVVASAAGTVDAIVEARAENGTAVLVHVVVGPAESLDHDSDLWGRLRIEGRVARAFIGADALGYRVQSAIVDVVAMPASVDVAPQIARRSFERDEAEIARALADLAEVAGEIDDARDHFRYPRAVAACKVEDGRSCGFFGVCLGLDRLEDLPRTHAGEQIMLLDDAGGAR